MPWHIDDDHPDCQGFAVVKDGTTEVEGCHRTRAQAERQMAALYASENDYMRADAPAPQKDQIEGSEKNEPGSAAGKSGGIELNEATSTALANKAKAHNEQMSEENRPTWTRVTTGALKSVYRRGAGAYSTSHRPGIGRAQWAMARVNAFLYLARTGRPQNAAYVGDNDLLNSEHPKYLKNDEARAPGVPTGEMREEAQRGLDWRAEFGRGGTEIGVARARDIVNGRTLSRDTIQRMRSFFARHEVDKQAEGFRPGEDGYPSAGRIAWALWGGDPGRTWADAQIDDMEDRAAPRSRREQVEEILAELRAVRYSLK